MARACPPRVNEVQSSASLNDLGDCRVRVRDVIRLVEDVIRLIEEDGWFVVATPGSHRQYKHAVKSGRVTIAGKPSDDMAPGTLNSVLKQAGLKELK
jgi:predicted RNA binding protein YcfA (HicA-like mRNA interferase family)